MPLVSVIMPVYKVEKYLEQCLTSVIEQDLKDIEIVVIDDGSPDNCGDIIRRFASVDKRIRAIFQKNSGYAQAINVGLAAATGKYIAIVETDDFVEPDMLSTLYEAAEKYRAKIAKAGFTKIFPNGSKQYCKPCCSFYRPEVIVEPMCNNDIMIMESSIWTAIYDREFLLSNDIKLPPFSGAAYQDVIFKFMTYTSVDYLVCIDKSVYNYRVFSENSSSKSTKYWDRCFKNYDVIKSWLVQHGVYDCYKHAFYISIAADTRFHYDRLSNDTRPLFCEAFRNVSREANEEGVDIFHPRFRDKGLEWYYYNEVIPLLEQIIYSTQGQNNQTLQNDNNPLPWKKRCNKVIKEALRVANRTKVIHKLSDGVISILRRPFFINKIIDGELIGPSQDKTSLHCMNNGIDRVEFDYPTNKKKILAILPWFDSNAVNANIDNLASVFRMQGYETHLFIYWSADAPNIAHAKDWDRVFWKHAENWYFGCNDSTDAAPDGNRVDDWVADDFLEAVIRLNNHYKYDICLANYLIFTSAFQGLPDSVLKVLYTHDRFAGRNSALQAAGFRRESFWFGVATEAEEAAALKRSDIILAIQEEDAAYFRRITDNKKNVMVVPYIPEADFIDYKGLRGREILEVGYIASANPPNVKSITNVIKLIDKDSRIKLHVAGSVTYALDSSLFHQNVVNEGIVDSLRDFYAKCDVMINPDMFYSGLKVKTAEAMRFGAPIVCTKVASTCLPLDKQYQKLDNEKACVDYLNGLAAMEYQYKLAQIDEMREESRAKYLIYQEKYPLEELVKEICEASRVKE